MNNGWASKGGIIPGGPHPVRLKDGERVWAKEGDQLIEYIHEVDIFGEQWRLRKTGRTTKRKRKPIVKVRKSKSLFNMLFGWLWKWECRICYQNRLASTWEKAIEQATRHARNHHRSTR